MKPMILCLAVLVSLQVSLGQDVPEAVPSTASKSGTATTPAITRDTVAGKRFKFSWKSEDDHGFNGTATLNANGSISGIGSPNESSWIVDETGRLLFRHRDGRISTRYEKAQMVNGGLSFEGPFLFQAGIMHLLSEVTGPSGEEELMAKLRYYSSQTVVCLDPGDTYPFRFKNGTVRAIRLKSVMEHKEKVIGLVRRADVRLELDGKPLNLVCAPYVMPTETDGIRIQADTTSAWLDIPKRIQLSIWDASEPIVNTKRFAFPLRNYRLFSHGTQAYGEPVHLGQGDGDPSGQRFYHDYGFDMAGYEGREEIFSAVEGRIVKFSPSRDDPCSVLLQDDNGFIWEHAHMQAYASQLALGARVALGQKLGLLGKTGPSGNFSHLHVGTFLSREHADQDRGNRRLNLYPWMVTAYQALHPSGLFAVARPHQTVLTGEKVTLDGSNSLAWGGRKIVEWRWIFPDGQIIRQARAKKVFDKPGAHVAELWVKDIQGAEDVDFCQIKVFSRANPEKAMPHIFMTHSPAGDIRPGQPVTFRLWFQGSNPGPLTIDFADGTRLTDYRSYSEVNHSFKSPGIHVVTAECSANGHPITQKQKVLVAAAPPPSNR